MMLQEKLEKEARRAGAAYVGVADLSLTKGGAITPNEAKLISEFPFAISIGVPLLSTIVERIGEQTDAYGLYNYWFHVYNIVNPLINQITLQLSNIIESQGYLALQIPASQVVGTENHYGTFSHKMAASLSGLGWIGKSCLLIIPDRGPRVRWGTILTDIPLKAGIPSTVKCGNCSKCVEACPPKAFTGKNFDPSEPRETRMLVARHTQYVQEQDRNIGKAVCGMCVYVCPYGKAEGVKK